MMTDQNAAVLEVSVEEKSITPMPQTPLNDTPTVNVTTQFHDNPALMFLYFC